MRKTVFFIPKMDCPSEENLIRLALADIESIEYLEFDLAGRALIAFHNNEDKVLLERLEPLNFDATIAESRKLTELEFSLIGMKITKAQGHEVEERRVLRVLLAINFVMFVLEFLWGMQSESTGLIADAMDMFADATIYGISLYAVGRSLATQRKTARISGYAQLALALFALAEVVRRFIYGSDPDAASMMGVSIVALVANIVCLVLINKHRSGGLHMKASAIFSANDVVANTGVIFAGLCVAWTDSRLPDLIIGILIAMVVLRGAVAILKISRESK